MVAKRQNPRAASGDDTTVVVRDGKGRVRSTYSFGSAVLRSSRGVGQLSAETLALSSKAMQQLGGRLMKPGVRLPERKGVPKFYADEADPALVVRELDGKLERGRFEDGQFKAIA